MSAMAKVVGLRFMLASDNEGEVVKDEVILDCERALKEELGEMWDGFEWWTEDSLAVEIYWSGAPLIHQIMERACKVYDKFLTDKEDE